MMISVVFTPVRAAEVGADEYRKRSHEKRRAGDPAGALLEADRAVKLQPDSHALWARALCYYQLERWDEAVADFRKVYQAGYSSRPQILLLIWAARAQAGESEMANKELERKMEAELNLRDISANPPSPLPPGDFWFLAAARYALGTMTEADFFVVPPPAHMNIPRRTKNGPAARRSCEALYYAGVKRLLAGDKKMATQYFKQCAAAAASDGLIERHFALAKLQRLGSD